MAIAEFLKITPKIAQMIIEERSMQDIADEAIFNNQMLTLKDDGHWRLGSDPPVSLIELRKALS